MSKASAKPVRTKVTEIEPFDKRTVNYNSLKPGLTTNELKPFLGLSPGVVVGLPYYLGLIDTLSVTKTIGKGRTNLTLIEPTIVQVDAMVPSATFDKTKSSRNPSVQVHFEPKGYGITGRSSYLVDFTLEVFTPASFNFVAQAGGSAVSNTGVKSLNGLVTVTIVLQDVAPNTQTYIYAEQQSGASWNWLSTQFFYPPLVATK